MSRSQFRRNLARVAILCVVASFVLAPMVATVLGNFKSNAELRMNVFALPETWDVGFYAAILGDPAFWRYLAIRC